MTSEEMAGYLEMYLAASKEHGFRPDGLQDIVRYLLVNGHIHVRESTLALMGDREFFLGADKVPEELHEKLIKATEASRGDWTLDDDYEMEETEHISTVLEGIHIKAGRVTGIKVGVNRIIRVYQTYDTPTIDEALLE